MFAITTNVAHNVEYREAGAEHRHNVCSYRILQVHCVHAIYAVTKYIEWHSWLRVELLLDILRNVCTWKENMQSLLGNKLCNFSEKRISQQNLKKALRNLFALYKRMRRKWGTTLLVEVSVDGWGFLVWCDLLTFAQGIDIFISQSIQVQHGVEYFGIWKVIENHIFEYSQAMLIR